MLKFLKLKYIGNWEEVCMCMCVCVEMLEVVHVVALLHL